MFIKPYGEVVRYSGADIDPLGWGVECYDGTNYWPITLEGESLELDPLYKLDTRGKWQEMRVWYWIDDKQEGFIKSCIMVEGRKDRYYSSPMKMVNSKTRAQCLLEQTVSKWNRKKDRDGWSLKREVSQYREPMLLHRWDREKVRRGPWLVSPKMDGVRGLFYSSTNELVSRKRMPFEIKSLCSALATLCADLDGEIWTEGKPFEEIVGCVKRKTGTQDFGEMTKGMLHYNIFDRFDMPDVPYVERLASIHELDLSGLDSVHIVQSIYCTTEQEVEEAFKHFLDLGFEGAVARTLTHLYQMDSRSHEVLKLRPTFSKEFKVTDVVYDNDVLGKLISFMLKTEDGLEFKATPSMSKQERLDAYQDYTNCKVAYTGKMMTCDYREVSVKGCPKHAVAKGLRID